MKKCNNNKPTKEEENLQKGIDLIREHPVFRWTRVNSIIPKYNMPKDAIAYADHETVYVNAKKYLEPKEWSWALAHCKLHMILGHWDLNKLPGYEVTKADGNKEWKEEFDQKLWSAACDIYIAKFLNEMKFGRSIYNINFSAIPCNVADEKKIYEYLVKLGGVPEELQCDTANPGMVGLDKPIRYEDGEENLEAEEFLEGIAWAVTDSIRLVASGEKLSPWSIGAQLDSIKNWFLTNYPMLGSVAAPFQIMMDKNICQKEEISVAAINVQAGEIYINPLANLSKEECRFVVAHELLHAGLQHGERCQGRDAYLWNVACDFVINGWLNDMGVGEMPEGCLYDIAYKDWSAESIYEELIKEIRKNYKLNTLRGYGKGDIISGSKGKKVSTYCGMTLDEFCKSALSQGLEFHFAHRRGFIPAGLVEEIRALCMPVIPWNVELARWLDCFIPPIEKHRSYARPSRRQGSTPDIPRPRYVKQNVKEDSRTFGVIIDTSGSMSAKMIGMALGSIASYAAAKEVPMVRVVFCDASAYDAGYLAPEDIAGLVEVKGRGGTELQPAVDFLEKAEDFPDDGPILLITDGEIEDKMIVRHNHAYLIPRGRSLPFVPKGKVFYFEG